MERLRDPERTPRLGGRRQDGVDFMYPHVSARPLQPELHILPAQDEFFTALKIVGTAVDRLLKIASAARRGSVMAITDQALRP